MTYGYSMVIQWLPDGYSWLLVNTIVNESRPVKLLTNKDAIRKTFNLFHVFLFKLSYYYKRSNG